MFNHLVLGSNDLERSRKFYDAIIATQGGEPGTMDPKGRILYAHDGGRLLITTPLDGAPATPANGFTLGFRMDSPEQAEAWHEAGLAAGGTAVEDPPGIRALGAIKLFLAYLRDPDGHKLCATYRYPA